MTAGPLVTIVTPSYQQAAFLPDNLRSIREQSYPSIEHIVRDGGSTDGTVDILREATGVTWKSERDGGQTDALNKGFAIARGEILGWVNSDDFLYPRAVEMAVEALQHSEVGAVYGRCVLVDASGGQIGAYRTEPFSYARLLVRNIIAQPAVFLRRELYEHFGALDAGLGFAMDYEYWLRCSRMAPFVHVPELFAAYRIHPAGKTSAGAIRHAAEANRLRMRYGRGILPTWRLRLACARTWIGGFVKSSATGIWLLRVASWQRARP